MAEAASQFPIPTTQFPVGPRRLGLLIFLGSESMIFLSVISMYVIGQGFRGHPTPAESLSALRMVPFSVALWLSSLTIWLAPRRGMRPFLGLTFILGAIFLGGEAWEWIDLFHKQVTAANNIWSTTFFTLTGVHGMHVIMGLLMMLGMLGYSARHTLTHDGESAFELVSIYWHFVDGMWVLIYGIIYFWSAFLGG